MTTLSKRLATLRAVLPTTDLSHIERAEDDSPATFRDAMAQMSTNVSPELRERLALVHGLADVTDDDVALVGAFSRVPHVTTLRDVALLPKAELGRIVDETIDIDPGAAEPGLAKAVALDGFSRRLFAAETTSVLRRMVRDDELPIARQEVKAKVAAFFEARPDFDIRTTSLYSVLGKRTDEDAEGEDAEVVETLKTLQRIQAIAPRAEAVATLMARSFVSAQSVTDVPEATFIAAHGEALGTEDAKRVYARAASVRIRNEHALIGFRETYRGSGLRAVDGDETEEDRKKAVANALADKNLPFNLETLFGSQDMCECAHCTSVLSPAAYYVELLQYLRNNNTKTDDPRSLVGTPLEHLFARRPDLGCLELTCENSNTVLPYVDLANEVMESFVVHREKYAAETRAPKRVTLDVHNVDDETSGELLAEPRHPNVTAYAVLKNAVYPLSMPYHQPIDAARAYLKHLGTSRHELLDTMRTAHDWDAAGDPRVHLDALHAEAQARAVDAEALGMVHEEYIILARESFWSKAYVEAVTGAPKADDAYRADIGVRAAPEYYGYDGPTAEADMLSLDESKKLGLTFVKAQFLPRTGVAYGDLVDALRTRFVNPLTVRTRAISLMSEIRGSYRLLQQLVDASSTDAEIRFARVVDQIVQLQKARAVLDASDPCRTERRPVLGLAEIRQWVHCDFEPLGKLIVLESGEPPTLARSGRITRRGGQPFGTLESTGTIVDLDGAPLGRVLPDSSVVWSSDAGRNLLLYVRDEDNAIVGRLQDERYVEVVVGSTWGPARWFASIESCDLEKVRIRHLDGTPLEATEYERLLRLLRLWRRLGFTIAETDQLVYGIASASSPALPALPGATETNAYGAVCPVPPRVPSVDITPALLHEMVATKEVLERTGLVLPRLLAFWDTIGTYGEGALYTKTFLTHDLLGIDSIFAADERGAFLEQGATISGHAGVLAAALRIDEAALESIRTLRGLGDELTLANVSILYRHAVLAKVLGVVPSALGGVLALFGDPFVSPSAARALFRAWDEMERTGLDFAKLAFVVLGVDNPKRPLAPKATTVLKFAKALSDGLVAIDRDHADLAAGDEEKATLDFVRAKAGLVFDPTVVERIVGLVEGTATYTTNAPVGLIVAIPEALEKRVKHVPGKVLPGVPAVAGQAQMVGVLSIADVAAAKALSADPGWTAAIDRLRKQPRRLFDDALFGLFPAGDPKADAARAILLSEDVLVGDTATPPKKRLTFLSRLLPFLRERLARTLVVGTLASAVGLAAETTEALLSEVLTTATGEPLLAPLLALRSAPTGATAWNGYLVPNGSDPVAFVAIADRAPAPIDVDGVAYPFLYQQEDPSNVFWTDPVALDPSRLATLHTTGLDPAALEWKSVVAPRAPVPSSALLPELATATIEEGLTRLGKAAIVIDALALSTTEVLHFQAHGAEFSGFDWNALAFAAWERLAAYHRLRDGISPGGSSLVDLFAWAHGPTAALTDVVSRIAATTGDDPKALSLLVRPLGFDVEIPVLFRDERALVAISRAMSLSRRVGVGVEQLFEWAAPHSTFTPRQTTAEAMRFAIRSRYERTEWEEVAKPIFDGLRENQRRALVDFLLVQEPLRAWGVHDADGLFEFFLIDVQMDPCLETSRIKQAISTAQLFVQRCFLGQEERAGTGVPRNLLDRKRWEWMQRYRVWEANRKVFLYPENWIEPELRDDKSPIYKELESELLQKDVTRDTVETALKSYLFKLDEIANLKVVGVYYDRETRPGEAVVHVFARTRSTPYVFFYRTFNETTRTWTPWSKVQVDIPSYEQTRDGALRGTGTYVVPVVWRSRPIVFFPVIALKTLAPSGTLELPMESQPMQYWEIRLAFSELHDGKWTPKQMSVESIATSPTFNVPQVGELELVPRIADWHPGGPSVVVDVQHTPEVAFGAFRFDGCSLSVERARYGAPAVGTKSFHDVRMVPLSLNLFSLQAIEKAAPHLEKSAPYFSDVGSSTTANVGAVSVDFTHRFSSDLLGRVHSRGVDGVYSLYAEKYSGSASTTADTYGLDGTDFHELRRPYALYNWEVGFHAPTLLADRLLKAQKFDEALAVLERVFDPKMAARTPADTKPYWTFPPFKEAKADRAMESFLRGLQPGKSDAVVTGWRDNPFSPHFVARARPAAYMKWTVMKYIEILIEYGDWYFRQNTLETIPYAIQLYVMAAHLFGPRGQRIPKRGKVETQTYLSLLNRWDAFGNAMGELELVFPFSNQTSEATVPLAGDPAFANVFGFASTLYFCIPANPRLEEVRATIDDRLFKIRHCQDIDGVVRKLPLFEPPIDPALLVQATAQGLSLSSVLADLDGPMPNYRFPYLLQKALELCAELKSLSAAFLATKEKRDAEALARLRAKHERTMHTLAMEVRKLQLEEAERSIAALEQSRKAPASRMAYYLKLIGGDVNAVPKADGDFRELAIAVDKPSDSGGLRLTADEAEEILMSDVSFFIQQHVGLMETLAGGLHALPTFKTAAHPMGVGADVQWGFPNMANATSAHARGLRMVADHAAHQGIRAGRKAGHKRQLWERTHQANQAGYEVKNIDKQILTQKIRFAIASRELDNQQKQLDNALEVEDFLTNKYTNEELYSWMEGSLRGLYRQVYTLAFDVAKRAEKTFRFERGLSASKFLDMGYWNAARDGLLAGEQLFVGLKRLEAAYQEKRGHDFELTKAVSLRRLDPLAFLRLRETGTCEFSLPEVLFDMDFPGHYARRIKSVALSLPCVVGPYTSVNATLRLLEHEYRTSAIAKDKNDYPKREGEDDPRFATTNVPISAIAVSGAQNDSGVFELAFKDERYLPFEGAGAVTRWRLELPNKVRPFDYETLTDVVLHLRYTAIDGGDKLRGTASAHVDAYVKTVEELAKNEGLFAAFDLMSDFPDAWHRAKEPRVPAGERVLDLGSLYEWLPTFTRAWRPEKVLAADVILASSPGFSATLRAGSRDVALSPGAALGSLATAVARGADVPLVDWKLTITDPRVSLARAWIVVRYVLK